MSTTLQRKAPGALISSTPQTRELNAESVTFVAVSFLKRIGNKSGLKAKRVSMEEGVFVVEVEMKRLMAIVQVDSKTHEIRAYEIQAKGEEASMLPASPKLVALVFGLSAVTYVALSFAFKLLGI